MGLHKIIGNCCVPALTKIAEKTLVRTKITMKWWLFITFLMVIENQYEELNNKNNIFNINNSKLIDND